MKLNIIGSHLGAPTRISVSKRRQALELFAEGKGYKLIAKLLNLNVYTVRDWGREYRAGRFSAEGKSPVASDSMAKRVKTIYALRLQGLGVAEIAEKTGLTAQTVRSHLRRLLQKSISREVAQQDALGS